MRLTLLVVIFHILHRGKRRLDREIEPFVPHVRERFAHGYTGDVGFAILYSFVKINGIRIGNAAEKRRR